MAYNRTITRKVAEGCKPSALPDRRIRTGRSAPSTDADDRGCSSRNTRSPSTIAGARAQNPRSRAAKDGGEGERTTDRAGRAGYGGLAGRVAAGPRNARGPLAQTQSGFGVGDRVVNASGRGAWGVGTIVAVIPAGVNPRWWCRRNGWPLMFGRCETVHRPRYVVRDDRGKLVVPRKVERVPENAAFRTKEGIESLYGRCR